MKYKLSDGSEPKYDYRDSMFISREIECLKEDLEKNSMYRFTSRVIHGRINELEAQLEESKDIELSGEWEYV